MNITRLSLQNFLSHKESVIDVSSKKGLVLIEGINEDGRFDSNGSGKSAILEGILYGLTGSTLRNLGVNEVVNRNVGKDTEVSISFDNPSGEYQVNRYRKHTVEGNKLSVWKSGKDISKRLDKETQNLLDGIIDIPYDILINTILLGEGLSSRFTQLSDPDKKALIESTLNLNYDLNACKVSAHSKMKDRKLEEASLAGKISVIEEMLSQDEAVLVEKRREAEESLRSLPKGSILEDEITKLDDSIRLDSDKVRTLSSAIDEYSSLNSRLESLDTEVASYVQEITRILEEPVPHCSLCRQPISDNALKDEYISTFKSRIDSGTATMKEWQSKLNTMPDITLMQNTLKDLKKKIVEDMARRDTLWRSMHQAELQRSNIESTIKSIDAQLASRQESLTKKSEAEERLIEVRRDISDYEYLYNLFSPTGIVTVILEEAIEYINSRIKVYTEILMDKSYELELSKGKIVLKDSTGASYQSLSNGEKRRLDIAIQFSLHDYTCMYCGIGVNLLFIDEILDTLDATGVNNIIEVLNMKLEYCKLQCIFVITHNPALKSHFDEVITVHKSRDGNSNIV